MKKILLAALVVVFTSFFCFAQQASAPVSKTAQTSAGTQILTGTGKVGLIIIGDSTKGIKSQLSVVDDYGKSISFAVSDETSITDKDGKAVTIRDLNKGNKVIIVYSVGKKVNRAQSIKLIE